MYVENVSRRVSVAPAAGTGRVATIGRRTSFPQHMRIAVAPLTLAFALAAAVPAAAQPARCAQDVFAIDGQSVSVSTCAGAPDAGNVPVTQTYKTRGASFGHTVAVPLLAGAVSRVSADVSLAPLGLQRSLHVNIAYGDGRATIESALLRPGAIPLK